MQVFMVRHAHAGQRSQDGRDIFRQLSPEGHERATELTKIFADLTIDRVVSSPATRCVQTVEPLARSRDLPVEELQDLWEGSSIVDALTTLENLGAENVIACSHGDIIPALIDMLGGRGVSVSGRGCELGSIWILQFANGEWLGARYVSSSQTALV